MRAEGTAWVEEKLSSTSIGDERYRSLFGIDPRTLERVASTVLDARPT